MPALVPLVSALVLGLGLGPVGAPVADASAPNVESSSTDPTESVPAATEAQPSKVDPFEMPAREATNQLTTADARVYSCEGHNCEHPWTGPQPRYWGHAPRDRYTQLRHTGWGFLITGGAMAAGSIMAGTINMCGRDGARSGDCKRDTRVRLAVGFGSASALLLATGGALLGIAKRERRLGLGLDAGSRHGQLTLTGRF